MKQYGPILFIDDDPDDQLLFRPLFEQIAPHSELIFVDNGQKAIAYLRTTQDSPFLIISEVSMQVMNGLELRKQIEQDPILRKRSIPFIFFTHPVHRHLVEQAYDLTIQGFFEKKSNLADMADELKAIVAYWLRCIHPNRFDEDE